MTHVTKLPCDKGFPFNLVAPHRDRLAYETASHVFGQHKVDKILGKLHRTKISYELLIEDLLKFEGPRVPQLRHDPVYQLAFQTLREDLKIEKKLIPYTTGAIPHLADFPGQKSPGLPWKLEGYKTKQEVVDNPDNVSDIRKLWHHVGAGKNVHLPDCCLFARPMIAKEGKDKLRAVWGYPLDVYMEEARFFYPIQDYIKSQKHNFPIAYGLEMATGGMNMVNTMLNRNPSGKYICTDWKGFDKSIPPWLIRDAFSLLAELIDFEHVVDSENKVWKVRSKLSLRRWKKMIDYFIETPIRTCKGERFLISRGVPSGSCFTNLIDSLINCLITRFMVYHCTGMFPLDEIYLGDDGVVVVSGIINLQDMADIAMKYTGMELSVDKTYVTSNPDNVVFLGYYNINGRPYKPHDFLIASFVEPEHTRRTAEEAAAAALGQLWTTFDAGMAASWRQIIINIADRHNLSTKSIELFIRDNSHRYKFLRHVGIKVDTLTVPSVDDNGYIMAVEPPTASKFFIKPRIYNLHDVWKRATDYWRTIE